MKKQPSQYKSKFSPSKDDIESFEEIAIDNVKDVSYISKNIGFVGLFGSVLEKNSNPHDIDVLLLPKKETRTEDFLSATHDLFDRINRAYDYRCIPQTGGFPNYMLSEALLQRHVVHNYKKSYRTRLDSTKKQLDNVELGKDFTHLMLKLQQSWTLADRNFEIPDMFNLHFVALLGRDMCADNYIDKIKPLSGSLIETPEYSGLSDLQKNWYYRVQANPAPFFKGWDSEVTELFREDAHKKASFLNQHYDSSVDSIPNTPIYLGLGFEMLSYVVRDSLRYVLNPDFKPRQNTSLQDRIRSLFATNNRKRRTDNGRPGWSSFGSHYS